MKKLLIFVGMTAGGWIGWAIGERIGVMTALIVSTIFSGIGVYVGWRMGQAFFD
jgi:hypothetical protein